MAYKVVKDVDKFNDKTTLKMNKEYKLSKNLGIISHGAKIGIRHLSMPNVDSILLDYYYEATEENHDFPYLDEGDLILRINDRENVILPFVGAGDRDTSSYVDNNGREHITRYEYNFVEIDKATLEKIYNANSIELKVNGQNPIEYSANKCQGLIEYCKIFYNGLYNADVSTLEESKKGKGGCMSVVVIGALVVSAITILLFA